MATLPKKREPDVAIEITSQMIEEGFRVLRASGLADDYLAADKCTVADIFRAMWASRGCHREADCGHSL